ncbi:hypothetical protein [Alicyclobacillus macrosporangiidus]|uniref:DUF4013 domain-containing protein n=1 Tax=Alicyclobacillus macrosporangiidus TaxID=392015 RepID=A0A1I7KJC3_9BACL|nr:hypothetical protein [Alicyclobacillus macrosporangiidus]SFU97404.1 hypothetical protein SAMN05421543_11655 [Alicyclobacillus macrosporangiidus]
MVQRFWRAFLSLAALAAAFSAVSWVCLRWAHVGLSAPGGRLQLLTLPTGFPSLWNFIHPATGVHWVFPLLVLLVQVFLTGGFYGVLVRVDTGQPAGLSTFLADAARSFWRLLTWNLLWTALGLTAVGIAQALPALATLLSVGVLLARFVFLFGDVALVCEPAMREAIRSAAEALLHGFAPMLPFGAVMAASTGACLAISAQLPGWGLLALGVVYSVFMAWVLHMVAARYLYFSRWEERAGLHLSS